MIIRRLLPFWLAWRDLLAEPIPVACFVVGLAATFAPLLVLAGLQHGIVRGLRQTLLEDPHTREIVTVANRSIPSATLDAIRASPSVAFLVPRVRTLAASVLVEVEAHPEQARRIELIPTAPGDPLLGATVPRTDRDIVLSAAASAFLDAPAGTRLVARVARLIDGREDLVRLPLLVGSVAPYAVTAHDAGYVTLRFAAAVENFQEGSARFGAPDIPSAQSYAGFRAYARTLEQVPALDAALRQRGIDIASRAGDVAGLLALDRRLTVLFGLVASLGVAGFLVSLGSHLWASVERKRPALALLRFVGIRGVGLLLFPLSQSVILALAGGAIGCAGALAVAEVINVVFKGTLQGGRPLCVISPLLAAGAIVLALLGAAAAALFAGVRASRIEAWEGVTRA